MIAFGSSLSRLQFEEGYDQCALGGVVAMLRASGWAAELGGRTYPPVSVQEIMQNSFGLCALGNAHEETQALYRENRQLTELVMQHEVTFRRGKRSLVIGPVVSGILRLETGSASVPELDGHGLDRLDADAYGVRLEQLQEAYLRRRSLEFVPVYTVPMGWGEETCVLVR